MSDLGCLQGRTRCKPGPEQPAFSSQDRFTFAGGACLTGGLFLVPHLAVGRFPIAAEREAPVDRPFGPVVAASWTQTGFHDADGVVQVHRLIDRRYNPPGGPTRLAVGVVDQCSVPFGSLSKALLMMTA